ncbi:hypothetical protein GW17_00053091, partial [Ensete ventricosum]
MFRLPAWGEKSPAGGDDARAARAATARGRPPGGVPRQSRLELSPRGELFRLPAWGEKSPAGGDSARVVRAATARERPPGGVAARAARGSVVCTAQYRAVRVLINYRTDTYCPY